jgi:hypothetical protein
MSASLFEESEGIELQTAVITPMVTPGEVLLGVLSAINDNGSPVVSFPQYAHFEAITYLATVPVTPQNIGRQVALVFTQGADPHPIVLGFLYSPLHQLLNAVLEQSDAANPADSHLDQTVFESALTSVNSPDASLAADTVHVDGKRVVLEGQDEVVLRCGEASITLTRNGKIAIRGKYLLSRSSGVNRILGGSVQVN